METTAPSRPDEPTSQNNHQGFPFDKLYRSYFGFANAVVQGEGLHYTMVLIHRDTQDRPYAQYRFPSFFLDAQNKSEYKGGKFAAAAGYLSACRIYLDDPANAFTSIYRMFQGFTNLKPGKDPLIASCLEDYFQESQSGTDWNQVPKPLYKPGTSPKLDIETFLKAEQDMVLSLFPDFPPKNTFFYPMPIIALGELKGAMYFVYDQTKLKETTIKNFEGYFRMLILQATREYEGVLHEQKTNDFAPKPEDPLAGYEDVFQDMNVSYAPFKTLREEGYKPKKPHIITDNHFLMDLGYDDYYKSLGLVLIEESKQVLRRTELALSTAIVSVIVDSFAHNIGAHSLVALKWWFENRFKIQDRGFKLDSAENTRIDKLTLHHEFSITELSKYAKKEDFHSDMGRSESAHDPNIISLMDLLRFMGAEQQNHFLTFAGAEKVIDPAPRLMPPLDDALYQFFEFLRNKSALWSGVTRDVAFSGRMRSWFYLLKGFLTNTLFLGTVANSEGINRVHIYIEIIRENGVIDESGEYAVVNLEILRKERFDEKEPYVREESISDKTENPDYSDYAFLRKGAAYDALKPKIQKLNPVFLPSEVIGQQVLSTLLENTLRNIKHYRDHHNSIRREGLRLYISIQPVPYLWRETDEKGKVKESDEPVLFKVGTWLHHPQNLVIEGRKGEPTAVIDAHSRQLKQRLLQSDGKVRLGGSSQDKVCAAFLMNNSFKSIDARYPWEGKKHYYPYVYAASELYQDPSVRISGFKPSETYLHPAYNKALRASTTVKRQIRYNAAIETYLMAHPKNEAKGLIKKYFHLWRGEDCKIVEADFDAQVENINRFRVIALPAGDDFPSRRDHYRRQGIMRIIPADAHLMDLHEKKDENQKYQYAIDQWLGNWFMNSQVRTGLVLQQPEGNKFNRVGVVVLEKTEKGNWKTSYHNAEKVREAIEMNALTETQLNMWPKLRLVHGQNKLRDDALRIRSHCAFMTYIFSGNAEIETLDEAVPDTVNRAKLFETVNTKIVIYDNRAFDRLHNYDFFRKEDPPVKTQEERIQKYLEFRSREIPLQHDLHVEVFPEKGRFVSPEILKIILPGCNFMIIHLSYLEIIWKDESTHETYSEQEVGLFFEEKIKNFYKETFQEDLPDNFQLVVTSGRGRADWDIKGLDPRITFRPIETILNAFEDGLAMKDDYQIKHSLCNLLYGS